MDLLLFSANTNSSPMVLIMGVRLIMGVQHISLHTLVTLLILILQHVKTSIVWHPYESACCHQSLLLLTPLQCKLSIRVQAVLDISVEWWSCHTMLVCTLAENVSYDSEGCLHGGLYVCVCQ